MHHFAVLVINIDQHYFMLCYCTSMGKVIHLHVFSSFL